MKKWCITEYLEQPTRGGYVMADTEDEAWEKYLNDFPGDVTDKWGKDHYEGAVDSECEAVED